MATYLITAAILFFSITSSSTAAPTQTNTLTISTTLANPNQHRTVSPSFVAFAFEQAAFYNYSFTSSGEPNTFSANLIASVLDRTGGTPLIRVGGTSGDRAHFNASQDNATNFPATEGATHFQAPWLSIGRPYFQAFKSFDAIGAKYVFQVPWDRAGIWRWKEEGYQNALAWTESGLDVLGASRLEALEIGNEPNYYLPNSITAEQYANRYRDIYGSLTQRFPGLLGQDKRIFQALDIADGAAATNRTKPFFVASGGGLNAIATGIKQIAYHYYQGTGTSTLSELQAWLSHTRTEKQLAIFTPDLEYLRNANNHPEIEFVLSEVADNVGAGATKSSIYNVLATALWRVDFMLAAMTMGIDKIHWQQIFNERISMWLPVRSSRAGAPRVLADYYALPFAADFIGASGKTKVTELDLENGDNGGGTLAAYAAYDAGRLTRVAVVNLDIWPPSEDGGGGGERPSRRFRLKMGTGAVKVQIRRLSAPDGALAKQGISWAGLQWTWDNQGDPQEAAVFETKESDNGVITVEVEASSAVMVSIV